MPPDESPLDPGSKRRYAVVGLGAIGGYYGARLAAAGHEVHFLARSDADHVRRHGLRVDSPTGDIHLPHAAVYDRAQDLPAVDVVLLAVKTTANDEAARLLAPLVGRDTVVVAMQNGLGIEQAIADVVPAVPVLGGMCFVCTNKVGPGHVRHLDYGSVTIGEHTADGSAAGITPAVDAVATDLERAGLPVQRIKDLVAGRWRKLVWNIPYNGLSVVLGADTAELMSDAATRELAELLMEEVASAAGACGHPIERAFIDSMLSATDQMAAYWPSMKLDHEASRPLEIETIYGAPIAAARAAGFEMAHTVSLYAQLRFLSARQVRTARQR